MSIFEKRRYFLMSVDPVHVGTGGTRLGRVDNSIVREPGTRLPKLPGTSLSGVIRSYAAYRYGKRNCAGQKNHCCRPTCPICYTFGFVKGEGTEQAQSGVVSIGDARILLFPVYSMAGPVWVSTEAILKESAFKLNNQNIPLTTMEWGKVLNLGWLMIEKPGKVEIAPPGDLTNRDEWKTIGNRIVLISDKLFSHVVNSNLEVRTSVSIDPKTGAAAKGALFTYEAIPRTTFLWLDVVTDDYRCAFPSKKRLEEWEKTFNDGDYEAKQNLLKGWRLWKDSDGDAKVQEATQKALGWVKEDVGKYGISTLPLPNSGWSEKSDNDQDDHCENVVTAGLAWAEHLGIGGMGTRGFGRVRKVAEVKL